MAYDYFGGALMKRMLKRTLSMLLAAVMIFGVSPIGELSDVFAVEAEAATYSGTCGPKLKWTLVEETGELVISGIGDMTDWSDDGSPWCKYRLSIKSVTIGDGVTSIGNCAFYECYNLTNIIISDSVTSIGDSAFSNCRNLANVTIPDSVTSIGAHAFNTCYSLTSIEIPESVTSIGSFAFYNTAYYNDTSNWENDVLYINKRLIKAKDTISGEYIIKNGTSTIADSAFCWSTSLTSVTIPDSVTSIGDSAFDACYGLTSVTIPDSVTSIGYYAFFACNRLTSVTIPDSVTSIGDGAFYGTAYYNNTSNWENDVLYIGKHLIEARTSISGDYTIKNGTLTIADSAFYRNRDLTSVTIPDSVKSIGDYAFSESYKITSVKISDSVTSIGSWAFAYCDNLTSVTIPDSVTSIGDYAFYDCDSLTSITIPDSVTSIGDEAFYECYSLTSVTIGDGVKTLNGFDFSSYPNLTSVTIGNSVTSIGNSAFYGCSSLTSVTIPDSVTSIGYYAFYSCDSLTDVYYSGTEEEWNKISIGSYNEALTNATIHFNYKPAEDAEIELPEDSGIIIKDSFIIGLPMNVTLETISDYIPVTGGGSIVCDSDMIGTGTVVQIVDAVGEVVDEYELVFAGDINGDIIISTSDLVTLKSMCSGAVEIAENTAYWYAADLNGDGMVTSTDMTLIRSIINGAI